MKFYFCETCGKRITDEEIQGGLGKDKKLKGVFCSQCAVGVTTMESLPVTNEEAKKLLDADDSGPREATPASVPRGVRRSSGVRIPPAQKGAAPRASSSRMPGSDPATQHSGNRFLVPAIVTAAVVVVIGLVVFSGSGQKPSREPGDRKAHVKRDHVPSLPKTNKKDKIGRTAEVVAEPGVAAVLPSDPGTRLLCGFENDADARRWYYRIDAAGEIVRGSDGITQGNSCLRLKFPKSGRWPSINTADKRIVGDWSGFSALKMDIFNPGPAAVLVCFSITDLKKMKGNSGYSGRGYNAPVGASTFTYDLTRPRKARDGHTLDFSSITRFGFFLDRPKNAVSLMIDNVRLTK